MTNFNFQGKIIRHFWGKLIRQSTRKKVRNMRKSCLQYVTWGGQFLSLSIKGSLLVD